MTSHINSVLPTGFYYTQTIGVMKRGKASPCITPMAPKYAHVYVYNIICKIDAAIRKLEKVEERIGTAAYGLDNMTSKDVMESQMACLMEQRRVRADLLSEIRTKREEVRRLRIECAKIAPSKDVDEPEEQASVQNPYGLTLHLDMPRARKKPAVKMWKSTDVDCRNIMEHVEREWEKIHGNHSALTTKKTPGVRFARQRSR